jgi:hypothetical protein
MDLSVFTGGNRTQCYYSELERMLVSIVGEQDLFHRGGTIRTTLEKSLQSELSSTEGPMQEGAGETSGRIPVVMQGNKIRAIICGEGREAEARSKLESLGVFYTGYDVEVVDVDEIARDQLIDTVDNGKR